MATPGALPNQPDASTEQQNIDLATSMARLGALPYPSDACKCPEPLTLAPPRRGLMYYTLAQMPPNSNQIIGFDTFMTMRKALRNQLDA